ncbi:MAG: holo-ACP synthase [Dehalococcoidia bacterium]|nr:holo-ACP synthase [Dehalococcoidia bacterium]
MVAVGIDIIEVERIRAAVIRWGRRFLKRVYTVGELELCASHPTSLAARFAAKEAVMKALGARGLGWQEIEVLPGPQGEPVLHLHGRALSRAAEMGITLAVSLSHCRQYAIASVVCQG